MYRLFFIAIALTAASAQAQRPGPEHRQPGFPIQIVQSEVPVTAAVTDSAADHEQPMVLTRPKAARSDAGNSGGVPSRGRAFTTVVTSLGIVLGIFVLVVWFFRRANPKGNLALPGEVVETLGRAPLNARQEMQLVRIGNKLLLLSVTATSAETLTEISDPHEIERLAGICRHSQPDSISASFREMLAQFGSSRQDQSFSPAARS